MVNLRVVTERTRRLGVDGFVCEVQLLLQDFVALEVRTPPRRARAPTPLAHLPEMF